MKTLQSTYATMGTGMIYIARRGLAELTSQHPVRVLCTPAELDEIRKTVQLLDVINKRYDDYGITGDMLPKESIGSTGINEVRQL